jgi:hypothetical protein
MFAVPKKKDNYRKSSQLLGHWLTEESKSMNGEKGCMHYTYI